MEKDKLFPHKQLLFWKFSKKSMGCQASKLPLKVDIVAIICHIELRCMCHLAIFYHEAEITIADIDSFRCN